MTDTPLPRTVVRPDHALIAPETHVAGPVPGWTGAEVVTLIAPAMGARFAMSRVRMGPGGSAGAPAQGCERFAYVLAGTVTLGLATGGRDLGRGGFAHLPAGAPHALTSSSGAEFVVIDVPWAPPPDGTAPDPVAGDAAEVEAVPMLGDPSLRVRALLPEAPPYDLAVNLMTFDPGAALPFTECHVMEHGLLVLEGTLVYRLGDAWYRIGAGDVVWMAPFCPQWACAYGTGPATYLIYKDWNRDVRW